MKLCTYTREEYRLRAEKAHEDLKKEFNSDIILEKTFLVQIRRVLRTEASHHIVNGLYTYISDQSLFLFPDSTEEGRYKNAHLMGNNGSRITKLEEALDHGFVIDGTICDEYLALEESLLEKMKKRRERKRG